MNNNYNYNQQPQNYNTPQQAPYPYPPQYPQQPPQKDNTVKIILIIFGVIAACAVGFIVLMYNIYLNSTKKVLDSARASSFVLYADKVVTAVQTQYMYDANMGIISGKGYYVYDITQDLNLTSTGNYKGYVVVDVSNIDNVEYIIFLYDPSFQLLNYNITENGMPTVDMIEDFEAEDAMTQARTALSSCKTAKGNSDLNCYNRKGYLIQ